MKKSTEGGFTLLEVIITAAVLLPILFAIISTKDVVSKTISANDRRADAGDQVRRVARRLRQIVRGGLFSTIKFRANQADIDWATAKEAQRLIDDPMGIPIPIPAMSDWISVPVLTPRQNCRFVAAAGTLAVNAGARTPPRSLEFVMDANEVDNDLDDDGDGIVDEGTLRFQYSTFSFVLMDNVEHCMFTFEDGGVMILDLRAARRDQAGRIHRSSIQQTIYLRNN